LELLEKENSIDFCNFWRRKIPLIFATFGEGKFHCFLQLLEKENSIDFCNFWKRKISLIFATFGKGKFR
jgi:hypothetical protein